MYILHRVSLSIVRQEYSYARRAQSVTMVLKRKQLVAWADLEELKAYARKIRQAYPNHDDFELLIEGTAVAEFKGDVWKIKRNYEEDLYDAHM